MTSQAARGVHGTALATRSNTPPHAHYSMRYDEEIVMCVVGLSCITGDESLHFCCHRIAKKTLHIDYSCASDAVISIGRHNCSRAHTTVQQREIIFSFTNSEYEKNFKKNEMIRN